MQAPLFWLCKTSSIKEIIGPCGEIVKFGDIDSFSRKISRVIKNKKIYINKEYINKYSFKKNIIKHNDIYSNLSKLRISNFDCILY